MRRRRAPRYQYRLVWRYQGQKHERTFVRDSPAAVLAMLYRVGTDQPWLGVSATQLRRAWAWVARRLNVPFGEVAHLSPKNALLALRDSFPALEYVRVEQRQVAPWVEMLDPLQTLRQASTEKTLARRAKTIEEVEAMQRTNTLDAWRWVPDEAAQWVRTRGDKA